MRIVSLFLVPAMLAAQSRLLEPPEHGVKTDDRIAALAKQVAAKPSA